MRRRLHLRAVGIVVVGLGALLASFFALPTGFNGGLFIAG